MNEMNYIVLFVILYSYHSIFFHQLFIILLYLNIIPFIFNISHFINMYIDSIIYIYEMKINIRVVVYYFTNFG